MLEVTWGYKIVFGHILAVVLAFVIAAAINAALDGIIAWSHRRERMKACEKSLATSGNTRHSTVA